jgi:hypothetical protein
MKFPNLAAPGFLVSLLSPTNNKKQFKFIIYVEKACGLYFLLTQGSKQDPDGGSRTCSCFFPTLKPVRLVVKVQPAIIAAILR